MLNAIIVDDEPYCCKVLANLLSKYCKEVTVVGLYNSGAVAVEAIREKKPQLVFLDVEMPKMNAFEMLEQIGRIDFCLIFTTGYDKYALKAIRFSAIDYLLKPVDRLELCEAVRKVIQHSENPIVHQMEVLFSKIRRPDVRIKKVPLPTMEGLLMVDIDSIVSCESESSYTIAFLKDNRKIVVCRLLKEMEEILENHPFARVHHSYIVNLNEVEKYVRGEGGYLVMSNGKHIDVSRSRKESLLEMLMPSKRK